MPGLAWRIGQNSTLQVHVFQSIFPATQAENTLCITKVTRVNMCSSMVWLVWRSERISLKKSQPSFRTKQAIVCHGDIFGKLAHGVGGWNGIGAVTWGRGWEEWSGGLGDEMTDGWTKEFRAFNPLAYRLTHQTKALSCTPLALRIAGFRVTGQFRVNHMTPKWFYTM